MISPINETNIAVEAIPKNLIQNLRPPKDLFGIKEVRTWREFNFAIREENRLDPFRLEENFTKGYFNKEFAASEVHIDR